MPSAKSVYEVTEMMDHYCDQPGNGTGGNLHIVLDDGNTSGRHVLWCLREAEKAGDRGGVELAEALLDMDESEREYVISGKGRRSV